MVEEDDDSAAGPERTAYDDGALILLHESVRVLLDAGERLRLQQETVATAVVVFHRFFAERSLHEYQATQRLDVVLMTCLFLAAKVEEQPRRIRDAINCVYFARRQLEALGSGDGLNDKDGEEAGKDGGRNGRDARQHNGETRGDKAAAALAPPPPPPVEEAILPLDCGYWEMKGSVVDTEQLVLRVLGFDLDTFQPYRLLLNYARSLRARPMLVEVAWALLNDSLFSPECCWRRPPQAQAVAALHLAQRLLVVQENEEEQQLQQQQRKEEVVQMPETSSSSSSSSSSTIRNKTHTFVVSSKSSSSTMSDEVKVDRAMWAVLGAKAQDVEACCNELLMLYGQGIGLSSSKAGEAKERR